MNNKWKSEEEEQLAEHIISKVCDNLDGTNSESCIYDYPRDKFFIGNLRPRPKEEEEQSFLRELLSKLAPIAYGAEFKINPDVEEIDILVNFEWSCYYRVFPSFEEQRKMQETLTQSDNAETPTESIYELDEDEELKEVIKGQSRSISKDDLLLKFSKVNCSVESNIFIDNHTQWSVDLEALKKAINDEFERIKNVILNDRNRIKVQEGEEENYIKVKPHHLESKEAFQRFKESFNEELIPEWDWEIHGEVRREKKDGKSERVLSLEFANRSSQQDNPNIESYFFETKTNFKINDNCILPFEVELAPESFKYDRYVWGRGFNCNIDVTSKGGSSIEFSTGHVPIYYQNRYVTQTKPKASFTELAENPLPILKTILDEMNQYLKVWDRAEENYGTIYDNWNELKVEFENDKQKFINEINLFKKGFKLIQKNQDCQYAFRLLNETFEKIGEQKGYEGWRLFQIVFIVTQVPSIHGLVSQKDFYQEERSLVDIIYFPTGGGKTEAYLGTIIYQLFFDRLRGKKGGISAWTRFPLRLLTLQQTQRMANVVGNAELIRNEQSDSRLSSEDVDEFSVGYFVGKGGSPNEIYNPDEYGYSKPEAESTWSIANDKEARQRWKRITKCPSCNTESVVVDFDVEGKRLIHRCKNQDCKFKDGRIPIYVVDNEIYRYLPSVLVGTIDKLAGLGNQRKFAQLLGQVDRYCPKHGYANVECCQKDCKSGDFSPVDETSISGPDLFIQDELHLLKEGLGTFDGHYETFIQELLKEFGKNEPLKIIASTATIELFERQVQHLYGRKREKARVFPGPGPNLRESFYATTKDYSQRLFVGILPHNKTIFNAILELIEEYNKVIEELYRMPLGAENPYGGHVKPGTDSWKSLIDLYLTSLTYFLANRQLDEIHTDLKGHVDPELRKSTDSNGIKIHELTGSTTTDDVAEILSKVESPAKYEEERDTVLATSMVSHGVDVNRFNSMIFYGMPRQNAEYIQASSRVGRSHVGIVFNCLHPARERDRSHYLYFKKFHEYLGQLVEPVAINRWAKYSIDRTLPGLFMAIWLQLITKQFNDKPGRFYFKDYINQVYSRGLIDEKDFIPILERAYLGEGSEAIDQEKYKEKVTQRVRQFFDQIVSTGPDTKWLSEVFSPHKPMRSLRDVDEQITIELDSLGSRWLQNSNNEE